MFEGLFGGSPEQQGLMAALAQIAHASGPQRTPQGLYSILGGGLMAGQQVTQQAREQAQIGQLRDFAIRDKKSDYEAQELQRQRARELEALRSSYFKNGGPRAASAPAADRSANAMMQSLAGGGMPQMEAPGAPMAGGMPAAGGLDRGAMVQQRLAYAQFLRENGRGDAAQVEEDAALKLQPKVKEWQKVTVGDRVMYAPYFEDGSNGQPVPLEVAEKLDSINRGGSTELVNPYTGATVRSLANSASPDAILSSWTQQRGQNMTDARARELNAVTREGQQSQVVIDPVQGPMLVNKGTGQARQVMMNGQPVPGETAAKKAAAARNLMPLIGQAEKLIDGATGSYYGAAVDQGARLFGAATGGAQNIAQLRVLEGNIMMAQPRMEGPQSNMDVELYRQMAAQIGDPTVPNATKKAALKTLRTLYDKYDAAGAPSAGGGVKFLGFE